jgi:hypothetical protein
MRGEIPYNVVPIVEFQSRIIRGNYLDGSMLEIQMSQGGNTIRSIQYHVALAAILKRGDDWWIAQYSTLLDTGDERTSALVVMTFMFQ